VAGYGRRKRAQQQDWTADRRFHIAIARATRNPRSHRHRASLGYAAQVSRCGLYAGARPARGVQPRVSEHRRILEALAANTIRRPRALRCVTTSPGSSRICWRPPSPHALDDVPAKIDQTAPALQPQVGDLAGISPRQRTLSFRASRLSFRASRCPLRFSRMGPGSTCIRLYQDLRRISPALLGLEHTLPKLIIHKSNYVESLTGWDAERSGAGESREIYVGAPACCSRDSRCSSP